MKACSKLNLQAVQMLADLEIGNIDYKGQTALMLVCKIVPKTDEEKEYQLQIV